MSIKLVYITASNTGEAEKIGRHLVEARLAACVNIIGGMTSIYQWQGRVETSSEAVLIAKTEDMKVSALIEAVQASHSYSVPCCLVINIEDGNQEYCRWLLNNLTD